MLANSRFVIISIDLTIQLGFGSLKPSAEGFEGIMSNRRVTTYVRSRGEQYWPKSYLFRTAFLFRLQGHTADAEWVEAYVQKQFPAVCERRHQWYYFTARDPKLQHVLHGRLDESWITKECIRSGVSNNPSLRGDSWHNSDRTVDED